MFDCTDSVPFIYILCPKGIYLADVNIEAEGIKMVSGQPAGPSPQGPYPTYGPVYQPPHRAPIDYVKPFASDTILVLGIVVGMFFMMLGGILWAVADEEGIYELGNALEDIGMFLVVVAFLIGAVLRADMESKLRVALVVMAVLLVIWLGYGW